MPRRLRRPPRRCCCRAVLEPLEARQLLHGSDHFAVNVNFQPAIAAPAGYAADIGSTYGYRAASGFTFGWNTSAAAGARDRNDPRSPNQAYDTLNHFRSGYSWDLAVPNGTYSVKLVAGDPSAFDSVYKFNVEGVLTVSGTPTSTNRWITGTKTVDVTDGKLTVTNASGAVNNKICFIEVAHVEDAPPPPTSLPAAPSGFDARALSSSQVLLMWTDNSGIESGYKIERQLGTTGAFTQIATVGPNVTSFTDTGLAPTTAYGYRVRAFNAAGNSAYSGIDRTTTLAATAPSGPMFAWAGGASLPVARHEAASAVVNGKLYVFGGYYTTSVDATARVDVYDPATKTWARLADMPEAITHAGQAVDGDAVYLAGGFVGDLPGPSTNHVWKYDTSSDQWSRVVDLPGPRAGGALVRVGRDLHFFGGQGAGNLYTASDQSSHWRLALDDDDPQWTSIATFPAPRNHLAGVALNGKIYAIGGQKGDGEASANQSTVNVFDPASGAWSTAAPLPRPTGHIAGSTFVLNGRIVVAGGVTNGPAPLADVIEYDPATNTWVAMKKLPAARQAGMAAVINGTLIFTGGETGQAASQSTTWTATIGNTWETAAALPVPLAEVSAGIIGNKMYVIGEGNSSTYAYNLSTGTWGGALAPRPHVGDHHAAEVIDGKLYLFGGLAGGDNKVQIYNPATNTWSLGADIPFKTGSASTALIDGQVYLAGGITDFIVNIGGTTTNKAARYNPATNSWTMLPNMPQGINHAASSTDGDKLYIFGGRAGVGIVENGFTTVQVYNPATNSWSSSLTGAFAPLPQARGGMGKAVYYDGEFYVMGGETKDGAGATSNNVYSRVDVYNPATNAWRLAPALQTARHGIFPLLHAGRIYVAAGGTKAGASMSAVLEIFNPI